MGTLVDNEIVTRDDDPTHAQKAIYRLTEKGIQSLPVLAAMSSWTQKYCPQTRRPEAVALVRRGEQSIKQIQSALRTEHLRPRTPRTAP